MREHGHVRPATASGLLLVSPSLPPCPALRCGFILRDIRRKEIIRESSECDERNGNGQTDRRDKADRKVGKPVCVKCSRLLAYTVGKYSRYGGSARRVPRRGQGVHGAAKGT